MSTPTLRISSGPAAGQSVEIEGEVVIGRENADLTIEDTELSRRHVALRPVEGGIEIEDLGSLNGTFVNGQRISSPTTLTVSGMLKIGGSQVNLEISFPQATRMAQTPEAGSEVAPPGATVARAIPEPVADADVTAQRPVVDPDVTAQRPLVDPNVTVQRPVPSDATAKPSSPQGPDVTVKRPVGSAGPPPGTVRPPAPPSPPAEGTSGRSKGPPVPLIVGLVLLVVVVVLVLLLTSGGGAEAQTRKLDMKLDVGTVTARDKRLSEQRAGKNPIKWNFFGDIRGRPFGRGNVRALVTLQPGGPPAGAAAGGRPASGKPLAGKPRPATVTPRFVLRFAGGTVIATERITSTMERGGLKFVGTGRILSGTGDYEGAKGTFKVTGGRPKFKDPGEKFHWRGSVEY